MMVALLPEVLWFQSQLTWILLSFCSVPSIQCSNVWSGEMMLERSTNLACWPIDQFVLPLTSVIGWRMVELLLKTLWFQSYLTWILISCCSFPSNSNTYLHLIEFNFPTSYLNGQQNWIVDRLRPLVPIQGLIMVKVLHRVVCCR